MSRKTAQTTSNSAGKPYRRIVSRTLVKNGDGDGESISVKIEGEHDALSCPRFFPASKNDEVCRINGEEMWLSLRNMKDEEIQIRPAWSLRKRLRINGKTIGIIVKEVETPEELAAYRALARFHYRSPGGVGRRIPLIAKINAWNLPEVAGFVELSSSMIVNAARAKILDAPFHDADRGIRWQCWNWQTAHQYNNTLVRISRCVVYPEARGLGLAAILTKSAVAYARDRWHIGGLRPCFMEIIAEMLRYWPFVKKCGFVKVGETQGGGKSAAKAIAYLLKRKNSGEGYPKGGIVSMYRAHTEKLSEIKKKRRLSDNSVIKLLNTPPHKLGVEDWLALHGVHRGTKPTYMVGLTPSAKNHLRQQIKHAKSGDIADKLPHPKRTGVLASIRGMTVTACVKPKFSGECRKIQEAFGIVSPELKTEIVSDFSANFQAGEVILITGASGAGKSILLNAIASSVQQKRAAKLPKGVIVKGGRCEKKARIACLQKPPGNKAPIELLASNHHSLESAMRILARAGLAEAHLFVRPSYALSIGQTYRLALALALSQNPDIVFIDEFCEPLDEYTTAAVCRKLRQAAKSEGICVIAATANTANILPELRPNRIMLLSSGGRQKWLDGNLKPIT